MFRQEKFYIICDGVKTMALNDDNQIYWIDDIRKAFLFSDFQEAELYRRKNFKEEFHCFPIVRPILIQHLVL